MILPFSTRLALRQLHYLGVRLIGAFAGVCVSILLIFAQIGFQNALVDSSLNLARAFKGDIFIVGPQYETMAYSPPWFARSLIYKASAVEGVASARSVYNFISQIRNAGDGTAMTARFIAFDPDQPVFDDPQIRAQIPLMKLPRAALLDARSRRKFEAIVRQVQTEQTVPLFLQSQGSTLAPSFDVVGTFPLGPDFTIDGVVLLSDLNFYRFFQFPLDRIMLGVVRIMPGYDAAKVRDALASRLGAEAQIKLRDTLISDERDFLMNQTPIGVILGFGLAVGVSIGAVFLLQVLHNVIESNLSEYAVLRAMGYRDQFFIGLVSQIAIIIAILAFIPSLMLTVVLYRVVENATRLRFHLTTDVIGSVLAALLVMSAVAAVVGLRKLRGTNPLELFA
jgi:putative ABC transport system permease protein